MSLFIDNNEDTIRLNKGDVLFSVVKIMMEEFFQFLQLKNKD